ncbi:MAG TPA: choice-of-anchor P family protein [Nocardioidaceae bacterium]|nr:choice-of-anchor P family protein [Nocardioidaceae bacterium]
MGSRRVRLVSRLLAAAGAVVLVGGSPGTAHAATEYDGEATALRVEGMRLELLPNGMQALPPEVRQALQPLTDALDQVKAQAPQQLQGDSLTLGMPDQILGFAEFPQHAVTAEVPDNPLLSADVIEARSLEAPNGDLVSEASVAGLSLGGGVLSADVIRTRCAGDGDRMSVDVSQLALRSNQNIVDTEVALEPDTAVPIEGMGTITYNKQDTDGSTYAEGTNVTIEIDSDMSLAALARVFDTTAPVMESTIKKVLRDLSDTTFADGQRHLAPVGENLGALSGQPLYDALDQVLDQVEANAPEQVGNALNNIAHFGGTVTIANAACAQATTTSSGPPPQAPQVPPDEAVPATPVGNNPPLADTGSPAGMVGMGLAGFVALAVGGFVLVRLRRRPATG